MVLHMVCMCIFVYVCTCDGLKTILYIHLLYLDSDSKLPSNLPVIYMGFFYILDLNEAADYGTARLLKVCSEAEIDCHVADPRDLQIPRGDDGIHPTP